MRALSLFSGIGGIDLACEWAGIETVAFCEREPFCQKVLHKHWPHVPIYDDVCTLTKERLEADGIGTIDLIHSGYPCQPFSHAGKREGEEDDRYLWPEVKRLLQEIRPDWWVGENVAGHVTMGLDTVLADLESIHYTAQAFVIPACAINAPHRRDRVFIVAYSKSIHVQGYYDRSGEGESRGISRREFKSTMGGVTNGVSERLDEYRWPAYQGQHQNEWEQPRTSIRTGTSDDQLKALGNAVVPQQIYPILTAIKQIDDLIRAA